MFRPGIQTLTTTDAAIGTSGKPIRVFDAILVSGGTASTVILKNGTTTSGTSIIQLDGTINKATNWSSAQGVRFPAGCFADVDANTAALTVSYVEEF